MIMLMGDAKALAAGTYDGTVKGGGLSVPVVFAMDPALPALEVTPKQVTFSGLAGGVATAAQVFTVTTNPGTLGWTVGTSEGWLRVMSGTGVGTPPVEVRADPGKLAPGKYSGSVVFQGHGGQQAPVAVTLEVAPATAPNFSMEPKSLEFTKMQGSAGVGQQTVQLTGLTPEIVANTQIRWGTMSTTKSGGNWLSAVLVNAGVLPLTVQVYADANGLMPGVYDGEVFVTAATVGSASSPMLAVRLTVTAPKVLSYVINPVAVSISRMEGSVEKEFVEVALVPAQAGLQYTATEYTSGDTGGGWLIMDPVSGSGQMPNTVRLRIDPFNQKPGVHKGKLTVTATSTETGAVLTNAEQVCDVVLTVTAQPRPSVKVSALGDQGLIFDLDDPNGNPGIVSLAHLRNEGGGTVTVKVWSATPWLTFGSGDLQVSNEGSGVSLIGMLNPAGVPGKAGSYVGEYVLWVDGVGVIHNGTVSLLVKSSAPSIELAPTGTTLTLGEGYSPANAQVTFTVRNTGAAAQTISLTHGPLLTAHQGSELTLQPEQTAMLLYSVNGGLAAGVHMGGVALRASTKGGEVMSIFHVGIQVLAKPPLSVTGGGYQSVVAGGWAQYRIVLKNPRTEAATYYVSAGSLAGVTALNNVSADPASGIVAAGSELTVTVAGQAGAALGVYGQTVAVNFGGEPFLVPLVVGAMPAAAGTGQGKDRTAGGCVSGQLLTLFLNAQDGTVVKSGLPTAIEVLAVDTCGGLVTKGSVTALPSNGDAVITFVPGASAGIWVGTWTPVSAASPQVDLTVTAWNQATMLRGSAKVRLALQQVVLIPVVTSVSNPADGDTPSATAAGGWVAIQGKNLTTAKVEADVKPYPVELGGTKVLLGERALPLMMVSPGEVYAFVPYDVPAGSVLPLQVVRGQVGSTPEQVAINVQMPAVFRKDPNGDSREGRVLAARGDAWFETSLTNPVMSGDVLY